MAKRIIRKSQYNIPTKNVPVHHRYPAGMYRRVALIYVLRALCLPLFITLFIIAIVNDDQSLKLYALIPLGLFVVFTLLFWTSSSQVICRLCKTPFLKHLKCAKKEGKIPNVLGDRSFATAISLVLRRPTITCQYCTEKHKYFD